MKKLLPISVLYFILIFTSYNVEAQKFINAFTYFNNHYYEDTVNICEGDSIKIYSQNTNISSDFNSGILDSVWEPDSSVIMFSNPCPPTDLPASGANCWFGSNSYTRALESKSLILYGSNCKISWDMKYGDSQYSINCEPPDESDEGVFLQWSIDSGATWIRFTGVDIAPIGTYGTSNYQNGSGGYWTPASSNNTSGPYYTWNHYESPIPTDAVTPNTKFRFFQNLASSNSYDHWGLDNIIIKSDSGNLILEWRMDGNLISTTSNTNMQAPSSGIHTYIITAYNSIYGIYDSDTMIVIVNPKPIKPIITYNNGILKSNYLLGNQWYLNNSNVQGNPQSANNYYYYPLINGTYNATYTSVLGCESDFSIPIIVNNVGINDLESVSDISISPNPATNIITINYNGYKIKELKIFNLQGQQLILKPINNSEDNIMLNINNLAKGIYFLQLQTEKALLTKKIVISR